MRNCYTYRVGWYQFNKYYYGVRFARGCDPSDLWVSYFTSSKHVKAFRKVYGEPDVLEVRKVFGDNPRKAAEWEQTVLRKLNVEFNEKYLNRSRKNAYGANGKVWNEGRTKENCPVTYLTGRKISAARKGFRASEEAKKKMSMSGRKRAKDNSWNQLKNNSHKYDRFTSYDEFLSEVEKLYEPCWGIPDSITKKLGVTLKGVSNALKHLKRTPMIHQSRTKVFNKYGDKFSSYSDYCISILILHQKGYTPYQISNQLDINECGVNSLLHSVNLTENQSKTGPSKAGFKEVLVADALKTKSTTFTLEDNPLPKSLVVKLRETVCQVEDLFHSHVSNRKVT